MARIMVLLNANERDALRQLAERELRDPRAQAALLIRRGLESAGLILPEELAAPRQAVPVIGMQVNEVIQATNES